MQEFSPHVRLAPFRHLLCLAPNEPVDVLQLRLGLLGVQRVVDEAVTWLSHRYLIGNFKVVAQQRIELTLHVNYKQPALQSLERLKAAWKTDSDWLDELAAYSTKARQAKQCAHLIWRAAVMQVMLSAAAALEVATQLDEEEQACY